MGADAQNAKRRGDGGIGLQIPGWLLLARGGAGAGFRTPRGAEGGTSGWDDEGVKMFSKSIDIRRKPYIMGDAVEDV